MAPTYWALFNEGDDSIDNRGVSAPTVAVGAGLGALAIVAIIAAVIAAVVVAVMATAGIGIFAFKQVLFEVDSDITVDGMEMVSVFVCLSPSVFQPPPSVHSFSHLLLPSLPLLAPSLRLSPPFLLSYYARHLLAARREAASLGSGAHT